MTAPIITSIEKYVQDKNHVKKQSVRRHIYGVKLHRTSDGNIADSQRKNGFADVDRYEKRYGENSAQENQFAEQNQVAKTIRDTDKISYQIGMQIDKMEDALDAIIKQYPPYPPGSEERIAVLRKVNSIRKQIEELTFPPPKDDNPKMQTIPSPGLGIKIGKLNIKAVKGEDANTINGIPGGQDASGNRLTGIPEDAGDDEIRASIEQLKQTGNFIRRHREDIKSETMLLYKDEKTNMDSQVAEFKSLFIGKHLGHGSDNTLTITPSILKGYLL